MKRQHYELLGYNTDSRYPHDVRFRMYTTRRESAESFAQIPMIQFSDSGHGIVFVMRPVSRRQSRIQQVAEHVYKHWNGRALVAGGAA